MKKNHYRIFLHREHKNDYCDLVAIQAAEMNTLSYTPTAEQFHHIIERALLENNISGVQLFFNQELNRIYIDIQANDGEYYTGVCLEQIEIMEIAPASNE